MKIKLLIILTVSLNTTLILKNISITDNKNYDIGDIPDSSNNSEKVLFNFTNYQEANCGEATYEDDNGLVVIEAENLDITGTDWSIKSDFAGYTGAGYLSWDGNDNFNSPGNGLISAKIRINNPGVYRFRWHNRIGNGNNSTEHNDSWLRFPDATEFYADQNGSIIYPNGSGQSPNPEGSGSNGWFKIYLSSATNWTWSTQTSDNDPHQIFVEFGAAGIYTMEISGRSKDHLIDRITLSNNASDPLNLNNSETPCSDEVLSIDDVSDSVKKHSIRVFPNPANTSLFIDSDAEFKTVSVVDFKGREILKVEMSKYNNRLDVSQLQTGIYFVITNSGEKTRFLKK